MKIKNRNSRVQATIDMTPMLDIVFQLILFFLVSTTFAIVPGIKLNLPQSVTSEGTSQQGITIYVTEANQMYFNDEPVTKENLGDFLAKFDTGEINKIDFPVSLEADSMVTNGTIVGLFDIIRLNGYSVINLRTKTQ